MTWGSFDSDLAILHEECVRNGIPSPVGFVKNGRPYIRGKRHIDLCEVYGKAMIKMSVYKNRYRTLGLDDVARALLQKGKFGAGSISGGNVTAMPASVQKSYVLQDAQLVMDLLKVDNKQVIALMQAVSELTGLSLEQVCHSNISKWWTKVFDDMGCVPPYGITGSGKSENGLEQGFTFDYEGGLVIEPKRGLYHNLKVVDVQSLYPSISIFYNLSFDTINCRCCADRDDTKVPSGVIQAAGNKQYWICKLKEGAFPKKLREFKAERIRQKRLGNEVKQLGLKILLNGGYGLFGNLFFKYANVRVAELITAYGRYTLREMQRIAPGHGFAVVAGDTDSLFLDGGTDSGVSTLIAECKDRLGVTVELKEVYSKFVNIKKKHYFGVLADTGQIRSVGMEGKKNDRPLWVNNIFDQFLQDFKNGSDPTVKLKASITNLECGRIDPEDLKIRQRLSKDPEEYAQNHHCRKIGSQLGKRAGDVIWFFKADKGVSLDSKDISVRKYKQALFATVKDALEIMGYDANSLFDVYPSKRKINKPGSVRGSKFGNNMTDEAEQQEL
jgi:DNA polymerase I